MKSIRFTLVLLLLAAFGPGKGLCSWSCAFGSVSLSLTPSKKERSGGSGIPGAPATTTRGAKWA